MSTVNGHLSPLRYYLAALPDGEQEEIMSEMQAHLEDKAAALRAEGNTDPDAAAGAAFGDLGEIGAHLADVHARPARGQTFLAVVPFLMTGALPFIFAIVAATDRALGPATQQVRVFGLRLSHAETTATFWLIVLGIAGLFAYGGLWAAGHGAPLWTSAWLGSVLLGAVLVLQILMDDATEAVLVVCMFTLLVVAMIALVLLARRRGTLAALLIGLSLVVQCGICAAYLLSAPPLSESMLAAMLGAGLAIVGVITLAGALQRRRGYQAAIVLAIVLSMAPYAISLALTADAATAAVNALLNLAIPFVMLLLIPYWLGRRRQPAAG
jgi:hypothetical protein